MTGRILLGYIAFAAAVVGAAGLALRLLGSGDISGAMTGYAIGAGLIVAAFTAYCVRRFGWEGW